MHPDNIWYSVDVKPEKTAVSEVNYAVSTTQDNMVFM